MVNQNYNSLTNNYKTVTENVLQKHISSAKIPNLNQYRKSITIPTESFERGNGEKFAPNEDEKSAFTPGQFSCHSSLKTMARIQTLYF